MEILLLVPTIKLEEKKFFWLYFSHGKYTVAPYVWLISYINQSQKNSSVAAWKGRSRTGRLSSLSPRLVVTYYKRFAVEEDQGGEIDHDV